MFQVSAEACRGSAEACRGSAEACRGSAEACRGSAEPSLGVPDYPTTLLDPVVTYYNLFLCIHLPYASYRSILC
ncbi:unnamed protein product [Bursaphelenchus xylophilus]|uniref:(pine wood nematode) hypothetical protein n=1 Tax=Bursaphelenchus xylophilus TaxID=6326 RepID=A0A1I7RMH5_BURXY|nr:unnamed protein product [Bursaphelenchus xylophilus]CAG9118499.1 unnamed protein product [Bursaphelenchus xylophilus]